MDDTELMIIFAAGTVVLAVFAGIIYLISRKIGRRI